MMFDALETKLWNELQCSLNAIGTVTARYAKDGTTINIAARPGVEAPILMIACGPDGTSAVSAATAIGCFNPGKLLRAALDALIEDIAFKPYMPIGAPLVFEIGGAPGITQMTAIGRA